MKRCTRPLIVHFRSYPIDHLPSRFGKTLAVVLPLVFTLCGCFEERSVPIASHRIVQVADESAASKSILNTREWLTRTHEQLRPLLPKRDKPALVTAQLTNASGTPADVFGYFGIDANSQKTFFGNLNGLAHTAQAAQEHTSGEKPPPWDGFEDVWIPIRPGLELSARLGMAVDNGRVISADCIVVLPGFLGDKSILRTRDICLALRQSGLHALAIDLRGLGETGARHPDIPSTFGTLETGDLLAVSEWLEEQPHIQSSGLVGFCWGANQALLTAWEDGRADDDPDVSSLLKPLLRPRSPRRHFKAGVMAFSSVLQFETILEKTAKPCPIWADPVLNGLQDRIVEHMRLRGHENATSDMRQLIEAETAKSELAPSGTNSNGDGMNYVRVVTKRSPSVGSKLECARMPVLLVHAANDPLCSPQAVADLCSGLKNPNVAGMILAGGGHDGFAPYSRDYFYSLLLNFFNPSVGAAACQATPSEFRAAAR